MNKNQLYEEFKYLSKNVYKNKNKNEKWLHIQTENNIKTGFYADTFYKDNKIVIVFRGTNDIKDLYNDIYISGTMLPPQIVNARKFYEKIKKDFPNQKIYLTGHSLGGTIAAVIAAESGESAVTFGAFGIKNSYNPRFKNFDNIINFGNIQDPVFISNIKNQIGKTYIIGDFDKNIDKVVQSPAINKGKIDLTKHLIENMGDLSTAVEYKGQNLATEETRLFKLSVEKNVDLRFADPNTIITTEEISKMTSDEFIRNEDCIYQKLKEGKIMPEAEAKRRNLTVQNPSTEKSENNTSKSNNSDGHWVTINGNHVLID